MCLCVRAYQREHAIVAAQIGLQRIIARFGECGDDREAAATQRRVRVLKRQKKKRWDVVKITQQSVEIEVPEVRTKKMKVKRDETTGNKSIESVCASETMNLLAHKYACKYPSSKPPMAILLYLNHRARVLRAHGIDRRRLQMGDEHIDQLRAHILASPKITIKFSVSE